MADEPFIGEIKMFGGNFAPQSWAFCNGQLMAISQNTALFSLIGTTYGGDGVNTFALPDLRSRTPCHQGQGPGLSNYTMGEVGGVEAVTLTTGQLPAHAHAINCQSGTGNQASPANNFWAGTSAARQYQSAAPNSAMNATAVGPAGGSQPHDNIQPYLAVNFIIALFGVFPSRN